MAQEPRKYVLVPVSEFTPQMLEFTIQKDVNALRVCRFPDDPAKEYYLLKWRQGNPAIFRDYGKRNLNQITSILENELNEAEATERLLNNGIAPDKKNK